jgi:hypothetical protein
MHAISSDPTMTVTVRAAGGNAVWWCVLTVLCVVLLAPLTLADVPPLLDYPNHLARLFVLAFLPTDPVLARFYQPRWGIIPNLGLDLTVPPLLRIFPVHHVGRAVVGVTILLPAFGSIAYHRALTGRRSYWPLGSVLFVYNALLLRGFLNFIASMGIALLLAAVWIGWRERRASIAISLAAVGAVGLFFCHLTGLLLFAILIGAHELMMLRTSPLTPGWFGRRIASGLAVFTAPAVLYALSDLSGMRGAAVFRSVAGKADAALTPVLNYSWPLDLATAGFCVAVPALCFARRWCVVRFQAPLAAAVLTLLFAGLPNAFKGTFDLDTRFIVMLAFVAPAAMVPVAMPRRAATAIATGCFLLFAARMIVLDMEWIKWGGDLAEFRAAIAPIEPGDVVMTTGRPHGTPASHRLSDGTIVDAHLPALLVIEHRAWWPFLFDNVSQQPITTKEPYRTAAIAVDTSPDLIALLTSGDPRARPFTHVLAMGPEAVSADGLVRLSGNRQATLFAIDWQRLSRAQAASPRPGR